MPPPASDSLSDDARRQLVRESRDYWEATAASLDERPGEGDGDHHSLVFSTIDGLLAPNAGEHILEIACGNGELARRMARLGASVVATDFAETFIAQARKHPLPAASRVEFRVVDATSELELRALGRHVFDAAVCNMSLMDMAEIEPLFWALARLLKPGGRFVFTIMHPCFNHDGSRVVAIEGRAIRPCHRFPSNATSTSRPAAAVVAPTWHRAR